MEQECDTNFIKIINFNEFNTSINKYNDKTKGDFLETLTKCDTTGGAPTRDTKLNKYFFMILRCLIFSVVTEEILKEFFFLGGPLVMKELSICFIQLLKFLLTNGCSKQFPIIENMCPNYINLFIIFLNNLEIILIKLGPIIKYGLGTLIYATSIRDIYNDSKIYYYLLNHPEFIDDIEYPENTVFIVNKYNYPKDFVKSITDTINGATQQNSEGLVTTDSTHSNIPSHITKLNYIRRIYAEDEEETAAHQNDDDEDDDIAQVELDEFITDSGKYMYLNLIYTRFYINIGYLTVDYISNDQERNEIIKYMENRKDTGKLLELLQLIIPEPPIRNIASFLGERYKTSLVPENTKRSSITNGPPHGGKQKSKKSKKSKTKSKKNKNRKTKIQKIKNEKQKK